MAKKFLLILSGFFISIIIVELFLRTQPRTTLKLYDNEVYGHAYIPSQSGWFVPSSREYKTWVEINSHGWPDVEHNYEKPEGVKRIVILGDSFVENTQMPLEDRFFRQLQNKLGDKFEVIAIGRGNTGTAQQYLILKSYVLKYKPDLVIQMFLEANDVKNNSPLLQKDPYLPYLKQDGNGNLIEIPQIKRSERKLASIKETLKNFRITEFLLSVRQTMLERKSAKINSYPIDYHVYDKNYSDEYKDAWKITKVLLAKTKEEVEKSGSKYIMVALPGIEQVDKSKQENVLKQYPLMESFVDFEKPDNSLKDACEEENLSCYFLLPAFKNSQRKLYNFYEGHWNQDGTDLIVNILYEILTSEQLFH